MRIAWFTHRYYPCLGGAENFARAMVRRFVRAGHAVDVITSDAHDLWYFTDRTRPRVEAPAEEWVDGARVRRLAVRHYPLQRYVRRLVSYAPHWPTRCRVASYMPIIPGIERIRGDYDAVFALGFPYTLFAFAALQTARACGAPLMLSPFLHLATPGDPVHRRYTRPHQIRLLAQADLTLSPTELELRALERWRIPRTRLLHLPMAIEPAEVTGGRRDRLRHRLGIDPQAPVAGQLGALHPNKGTHDLIRAVARLNDRRPEHDPVYLLLAGASSPEFESFTAQLLPASARWLKPLGPLPAADLPDFYAALDVFAMPSRTDSFGIVFLEAWANALPVVAAAAGGVPEVVAHGHTGLLIPFGAVEALSDTLAHLLHDQPLAHRLGQAGQALVRQGFTWDDRFATLLSRIEAVVSTSPRHPGPHPLPVNPQPRGRGKGLVPRGARAVLNRGTRTLPRPPDA